MAVKQQTVYRELPTTSVLPINHTTLIPLVRRVLDREDAGVINWDYQQIYAGCGNGSVYRVIGDSREGETPIPWSLILKIVSSTGRNNHPSDQAYFRREAEAYQSGILDQLPGGLAGPRCLDITEASEHEIWMWLEEVTDEVGHKWPLERYGVTARHLGQFNGLYLTGKPIPSQSWVSRRWLRGWVNGNVSALIDRLRRSLDHPLVHRMYPADMPERFFRLWAERETFFEVLNRLPRTFCHLDAFRRNLFAVQCAERGDQTVAIDWAFTGEGGIGEEIAPLVAASLQSFEADAREARELDRIVFDGYLDGLRDAGWHGDTRLVRLGYTAALALRFVYPAGVILLDESRHARYEQSFERSIEDMIDGWIDVFNFLFDLVDEARDLLNVIR